MDYAKESLKLHEQWKGKIEVVATVPVWNEGRPLAWPTPPAWHSPVWRSRRTSTKAMS